ncbi:MAG: hypothetical protein IPK82_04280 [Polyangiaceae bacterium]|nr:hypothetical protein [Polyangiaceae bacterium]
MTRTSVRHAGRAIGSTGPTWKRRDFTFIPRARSCSTILSARSDNSCAHVEVAVLTCSTPLSSFTGRARRAIFVPTAVSQSCAETGGAATGAGARASLPRRITTPSDSGSVPRRRAIGNEE